MEPGTMPIGYVGQRFAGVSVRAQGGTGPYRITGTNLLGWPSSLDYNVDVAAGTATWHGTVTRIGEFPVRMVVEDAAGARSELMLTFVFRPDPNAAPLTLVMEPSTMPIGYVGQRFAGVSVRAQGGTGPYRITATNVLGWPSSLDYNVDAAAGTANWHGTVTRIGEFPVRMVVEDSAGARSELTLTFVFRPDPNVAPLTLAMEPSTMPVGYVGQRFPGLRVRAQGGTGPYRITGTNLLGWPSSLDYNVDTGAGTADWHGTVTRVGEFPVRMVVEDSSGARSELMLTFVFRPSPPSPQP
jgi:hypothetical protein